MVKITEITDKNTWEKFIENSPQANFLQSYIYGQTQMDIGKKVYFDGIFEDSKQIGVGLVVVESAKRGRHLVIAGGPLLPWDNSKVAKVYLTHLKALAKKERAVFIRIRPQIEDSPESKKLFKKLGFMPSPMHVTADHTLQLDLTNTEEDILAQMRKTTRYEIKQAQKFGIKVSTSKDVKDVKHFCDMQLETAKRHNFVPFSEKFITAEFKNFTETDKALLYTATLDKKILAQALIIFYPTEASYHFGASTEAGRKLPGAYAIQWEAIKEAKKRGIPRYNFWGIVGENQKTHRFYGVSVFKRGFGGHEVRYIPAHDLIIDPVRYYPLFIFESLRRKIRRLG